MANVERQQTVLNILQNLHQTKDKGLKELFWTELNYAQVNTPLSPRQWPETVTKRLAEAPTLFAAGGEGDAFHVIYMRLAGDDLSRNAERPVVGQLLRDHPYALFVFSNQAQTAWHFLNVKYDEQVATRRLVRRITIRQGEGLRTAAERVQLLDLAGINPHLSGITPLAIQQRCDVAFDVEAVTKDFFREIANWYFWALKHVAFPKDAPKEADGHDHISVIRLITRLIFCWFIREKGLIPGTLFDRRRLSEELEGFAPDKPHDTTSVFYRAILQNLFFATLNTEMDQRGWRREDQNFMAHSLYRHKECFRDPKAALEWFKNIPFLNGGLFECLDKDLGEGVEPRYKRVDGFSDRSDSRPTVPDFLFFGPEREVDLSADYGDKKFRKVRVRGLIDTLNHYKFTIEENTPIEQEVALDPELSGKVFENLLAAYNPETGATARKQTGSFYTPREIVDYMVDEALVACLKTKVQQTFLSVGPGDTGIPTGASQPNSADRNVCATLEHKLRHLFAYNDEPHPFTPPEVDALIAVIDGLKTLDPAVGSGAFPMGILHKLVFILGKLDPRNESWKERQIARVRDTLATAEKIEDATARERAVRELEQHIAGINEAFENNELDYGRKLYLIENCIYGVDIQPIAVQIAKMRFFISLIVDQKIDDAQPNRGVRPLPNLETKFVAANTLIGVNRPGQQLLRNLDIDKKEAELRRVRERHFLARTPRQKAKCRDDDTRLRAEIAELLKGDGWDTTTARRLASWNPYDQNTSADFFDPEWMFGVTDGFDIAIGNPPYVFARNSAAKGLTDADKSYFYAHYALAEYQVNLYPLFVERGSHFLTPSGVLCFITPNNWLTINTNKLLRKFVLAKSEVVIVNFYARVFESADVDSAIVVFRKSGGPSIVQLWEYEDGFRFIKEAECKFFLNQRDHIINFEAFKGGGVSELLMKIESQSDPLGLVADVKAGLKAYEVGKGDPPQSKEMKNQRVYHSTRQSSKSYIKYLDGKDVCRYRLNWSGEFLKFGYNLAAPRKDFRLYSTKRILVRQIPAKPPYCIHACLVEETCLNDLNSINVINFKESPEAVLGILNSRLVSFWFIHKFGKMQWETFPQFKVNELAEFPLPKMRIENLADIAKRVKQILAAKQQCPNADTSALEREIDQQVYALYGLTPEEIAIVEGSTQR